MPIFFVGILVETVSYCEGSSPKLAILVTKFSEYKVNLIKKSYPLECEYVIVGLGLKDNGKSLAAVERKIHLANALEVVFSYDIEIVVVTNGDYFKTLTRQPKVDTLIGIITDCPDYPSLKAIYCPTPEMLFYNQLKVSNQIERCFVSVGAFFKDVYVPAGTDIIKNGTFPTDLHSIQEQLSVALGKPALTVDTENYSLKHYDAGLASTCFCWNEGEGIVIPVENCPVTSSMIRNFFVAYAKKGGKIIFHNISYDVSVLIYHLFMDNLLDQKGLLYGLSVMLKNWECTKIISYLATNCCSGNDLDLKYQSQEFAGNYGIDVKDVRKVAMDDLLEYNLTDGLATWYVYNKNYPIMVADKQLEVYTNIFKPAVVDIIQMQLTGLAIDMVKVKSLKAQLSTKQEELLGILSRDPVVDSFIQTKKPELAVKKNLTLKKKVVTEDDIQFEFNPQSGPQVSRILYDPDFLGLPVIDYTDTGQPSTSGEVIENFLQYPDLPDNIRIFLTNLVEYKDVSKMLSTFIPAAETAQECDGWHYLFGNFNLGGTKSGRMSSSGPNLQNLPVKGKYGKLFKECFAAPPGWVMIGIDADSLEDKISAVTTGDPNKVAVYKYGYDGHCLRALSYFGEEIPNIELAPENSKTYCAMVGGSEIYFHSDEIIMYKGERLTGAELYAKIGGESNIC